jgi:predicted O-methyltransferase YrrM
VDHINIVDVLQRDRPSFHVGGTRCWNALPESLQTLQACAVEGARTLETGCGASTVVFAAQGADHTVISPDGREHRLVRAYCRSIGIDVGRVSFIDASSDDVLPSLITGRELDFAFIDGAHSFPYPVVDFHYISRSLKVGGQILVDDIAIPAVAPVFRFMNQEANWRLDRIVDDRAALFSLIELPPPEDYVLQAFNRHLDYSFAPLSSRIRISATDQVRAWRRTASERFPRLHRSWKSISGRFRS